MKKTILLFTALTAFAASAVQAQTIISLNFTQGGTNSLSSTDSAGVLAATNWNNVTGELDTSIYPVALNDSTGASSGISLTAGAGNWFDNASDPAPTGGGANQTMFSSMANMDSDGSPTSSFTLSGFGSNSYDVYLYIEERSRDFTSDKTYTISANSSSITFDEDLVVNYSGTFTEITTTDSGNYLLFEGVTGNDLVISGGGNNGDNNLGFTGVQVSVIPEPSSLALLAGAGLGLVMLRRRRA